MGGNNLLLLSIRRPYSRLIIAGKKKYELRKRPPRLDCKYVLIYETYPTKAIIGYFEINRILIKDVEKIWNITKDKSYVTKDFFEQYYKNKNNGVAFEIRNSKSFDKPIALSELGVERAPQDFMYVENKRISDLIEF